MFASVLGLRKINAGYLVTMGVKQSVSKFGTKYTLDFDLTFEHKTARVRTGWIVESVDKIPRLTTCYIKL